jgi:hypothetical protein
MLTIIRLNSGLGFVPTNVILNLNVLFNFMQRKAASLSTSKLYNSTVIFVYTLLKGLFSVAQTMPVKSKKGKGGVG